MGAKFGVDTTIYEGERKYEIIKARIRIRIRMRLQQIDLKEELYKVNLAESSVCACGNRRENAEHCFKDWKVQRNKS